MWGQPHCLRVGGKAKQSNYAMQRSALVVTPFTIEASGALNARRR